MKIINYLSNREIVALYEEMYSFETVSSMSQLSASPLLNLVLNLNKYGIGNSKSERILDLLCFDNLSKLKISLTLTDEEKLNIQEYMQGLPYFNESLDKQVDATLEIHGYRMMSVHNYIRNINSDFMEFPIFKIGWTDTIEKETELKNLFNTYLSKEDINIISHLKQAHNESITNFSILKLYLEDTSKTELFKLIYKLWFASNGYLIEEYEIFQILFKPIEVIMEKDFLSAELLIKDFEKRKIEKV